MKKVICLLIIIFALAPMEMSAQTQLVKWYNADFSETTTENHISSAPIATSSRVNMTNVDTWGPTDIFYNFSGWPTPQWDQTPEQTFNAGKYAQFTIKPDAGYEITMDRFTFTARTQGDQPWMRVRFSKQADFSTYTELLSPVQISTTYSDFNLPFPSGTVVGNGETLYVRIFVYNTYNNFHIKHNVSGSQGPSLFGKVMLASLTPPVAHDDNIGTVLNTAVTADILLNDDYKYTQPLTSINVVQQPTNGVVNINGITNVTYTPNNGFTGYDVFYYTLTNSVGTSNTAKVQVQVVDGTEQALTRWNNTSYTPQNYITGVVGVKMTKQGAMNLTYDENFEGNSFNIFRLSDLPTPNDFEGTLDPSKYIELGIKIGNVNDYSGLLKQLIFEYKSYGTANITVKYSKTQNFSGNVYTMVDNQPVTTTFQTASLNFTGDNFLYSGDTVYIRIYGFNTWQPIFFKFGQGSSTIGPAITGVVGNAFAVPCSKTLTWNGSSWTDHAVPNSDRNIIVQSPLILNNGQSLTACTCTVTSTGSVTLNSGSLLTVVKGIINNGSNFIVADGANLIQTENGAINTGNIEVQKAFTFSTGRQQYNYVSSPTVGTNLKSIYTGTLDNSVSALYYIESNDYFGNSNGAYIAGRGLALQEKTGSGTEGTSANPAKFRGVPFNGTLDYPLAFTNAAHGYNLVGNPYPSNLSIEELYEANLSAVNPTFYFWDNRANAIFSQQGSLYGGDSYAKYNAVSGTGTGSGIGAGTPPNTTRVPNGFVSPAQGFLVQAKAAGQVLKFSNTKMRVSNASTNFFGRSGAGTTKDRYWLTLKAPSSIETMMAVVHFENGQKTVGIEDSGFSGSSDEIYSMIDGQGLSINGLPSFDSEDVVALGYNAFNAGVHTITIFDKEGVFSNGQSIYLKDK